MLNVPYFVTAEKTIETIVRLLDEMRRASGATLSLKPALFEDYNRWMAERFPRFSWGAADCHSYYRNASGHAPVLFPGSFKEFSRLLDESGLHEYDLV